MASYAAYLGIVLPSAAQVQSGVSYGWGGTEFVGSFSGSGGSGDATLANQVLILNSLTLIINGGMIQPLVISAYDPRKRRLSLVQADDYNFTSGTHIDMQINLPSGVPSNACTVAFAAVHQEDSAQRIDLTLTLVSVAGVYYIRFQATSVKTNVAAGLYDWQAVITETANARRVTVISGDADLAAAVVP